MVDNALRDIIKDIYEDVALFNEPSFDRSIIGVDVKESKIVYSITSMYFEYMEQNGGSLDDAMDFVEDMIDNYQGDMPIVIDDTMFKLRGRLTDGGKFACEEI